MLGRVKETCGVGGGSLAVAGVSERCRDRRAAQAGAAEQSSTVTIADLCSCTGPEASSISQTSSTMQSWASWVNSHGASRGTSAFLWSSMTATAQPRPWQMPRLRSIRTTPLPSSTTATRPVVRFGGQRRQTCRCLADRRPNRAGRTLTSSQPEPRSTTQTRSAPSSPRRGCEEVGRALLRGSEHLRPVGPAGRADCVAPRHRVRLHSGHRVRAPNYLPRLAPAVRRHACRRRAPRSLARRRMRAHYTRQLSSDGTVASAWLKFSPSTGT